MAWRDIIGKSSAWRRYGIESFNMSEFYERSISDRFILRDGKKMILRQNFIKSKIYKK